MVLKSQITSSLRRTSDTKSTQKGLIVYTYTELKSYIENVIAYITEGVEKGHIILYVDHLAHCEAVKENFKDAGYSDTQLENIYFIETDEAYGIYEAVNLDNVLENLHQLFKKYIKKDNILRGWGLVTWKPQYGKAVIPYKENLLDKLFAKLASITGDHMNVYAYNSKSLSGALLNKLLQTHEYHMTDTDLLPSHLYNRGTIHFLRISETINFENILGDEDLHKDELAITGKIASNIAHELNNSLSIIQGQLQLLNKTGGINDKNKKNFDVINKVLKGMEQTASEFLELAKPHMENREKINLVQLIEDIRSLMEPSANNKVIEINVKTNNNMIEIFCNELKIRQVFINVIKNAIEAMDTGVITVELRDTGDRIYIDVSDNGPGIPNDVLNQLGSPFMTTKQNGTGLGLLICEKIIKGHHGDFILETEVGKGTTFTISLPKRIEADNELSF